jgi:menaquinone-dependent protoporphyrinogen oxidase
MNDQTSDVGSAGGSGERGPRVLVAYASACGSTREIAEFVGNALRGSGVDVDVESTQNAGDPKNYDAIIVGSAIRYDRWMPEARRFIKTYEESLSQLPVACFLVCLAVSRRTAKTERQTMAYAAKVRDLAPRVNPIDVGRFAGVLNYGKLSLPLRVLSGLLFAVMRVDEGDYRDWDAIATWTNAIRSEFGQRIGARHSEGSSP